MSFPSQLCFCSGFSSQYLDWNCSLWSVAWGYKVGNTIEPAKTDDCHSNRAFCPHEPTVSAKKPKKNNKTKTIPQVCSFFMSQRIIVLTSKLIRAKLNIITRLILTGCAVMILYKALCILFYIPQRKPQVKHQQLISLSECLSSVLLWPLSMAKFATNYKLL